MAKEVVAAADISKIRPAACVEVATESGLFTLCATESGVAMLVFPGESAADIDRRMKRYGLFLSERGKERAAEAGDELCGYMLGKVKRLNTPVDLSFHAAFQRDVYRALISVPFGETTTYGKLAESAGHPGKARAVGAAMRLNPAPIFIPCHRVLPASGLLGGWSGPEGWKDRLLALEGVVRKRA